MIKNRKYKIHFLSLIVFQTASISLFSYPISYSTKDASGIPFDQKLVELMNFKGGVFIEVGALDGVLYSNTRLLEELYDWTGILREPSEVLLDRLQKNRPNSKCFQCALGSFGEHETYAYGDFEGDPSASFTDRMDRPAAYRVFIRSLQSILDEYNLKHINFFSLDTEGYELNILKGIDFTKTKFDYLLIEIYTHQYTDIVTFLASKGYNLISNFSNYNRKDNPGWDGTHNNYLV